MFTWNLIVIIWLLEAGTRPPGAEMVGFFQVFVPSLLRALSVWQWYVVFLYRLYLATSLKTDTATGLNDDQWDIDRCVQFERPHLKRLASLLRSLLAGMGILYKNGGFHVICEKYRIGFILD